MAFHVAIARAQAAAFASVYSAPPKRSRDLQRDAVQEEASGTKIRAPDAYVRKIKRRLADDTELAAQIDAYQGQYPADEALELAARIWADHSPGARPPSRPTVEDQSEEGYARRVNLHSTYASELVEVLDLGGAQ